MRPHRCGGQCVCPEDGAVLLYHPGSGQHACRNIDCIHGHGMSLAAYLAYYVGMSEQGCQYVVEELRDSRGSLIDRLTCNAPVVPGYDVCAGHQAPLAEWEDWAYERYRDRLLGF